MSKYKLFITPSADRLFKKLPRRSREEILKELSVLEFNPFSGERLSEPLAFLYSYHFSVFGKSFRAAYTINVGARNVLIYHIGPRGEFYQRLRRLFGK